ncbi:hypothetical protein [Arthrobacter sp. S2(2024)]|uniref:hypothetical protein n=1 Tax=Arthrobacter sp. S2(2024) TaxID=3111911 RepID=UPI002FCA0420
MTIAKLGELIQPAKVKRAGDGDFPLLSMTMRNGLVPQGEKFKKRVAGADLSQYKVVQHNQLVVGFPIDEAVLAFQRSIPAGIVSPAYGVWDLADKVASDAPYLERFLRSPRAIAYYKAKLQGSTARRRSLPNPVFLDMEVPLPPLVEQRRITAILDKADKIRAKRREALARLDTLTQSIFHSMFSGQPAHTPLSDAIAGLTGGRNLVGAEDGSNPFRVLKISAVTSGRYLESESKALPDGYIPPKDHIVRQGDVLISRANTTELVGASALVESTTGTSALPDKLWRAIPAVGVDPRFLIATLQSAATRAEISRRATGSGGSMKNISKPKLLAIPISLPPFELQQTFATRVAAVERFKETHRKHLAELDALFASLQHRAFNGEL